MNAIGRIILMAAYAVLGLAAVGRASYQISTKLSQAPVPYLISGLSAVLYVVIAFALWRGWRRLALWGTSIELAGVLIVGTLGYLESSWWPDETVWTGYGSAYGWIPLILPLAALWVLVHQPTTANADSGTGTRVESDADGGAGTVGTPNEGASS